MQVPVLELTSIITREHQLECDLFLAGYSKTADWAKSDESSIILFPSSNG